MQRTPIEQRMGWPAGEQALRHEVILKMERGEMTPEQFKQAQKEIRRRKRKWSYVERWG